MNKVIKSILFSLFTFCALLIIFIITCEAIETKFFETLEFNSLETSAVSARQLFSICIDVGILVCAILGMIYMLKNKGFTRGINTALSIFAIFMFAMMISGVVELGFNSNFFRDSITIEPLFIVAETWALLTGVCLVVAACFNFNKHIITKFVLATIALCSTLVVPIISFVSISKGGADISIIMTAVFFLAALLLVLGLMISNFAFTRRNNKAGKNANEELIEIVEDGEDAVEKLKSIKELYDARILSPEEFNAAKAKYIKKI